MNERNTNRRAQTRSNRTTQRHQIDGRPTPRRQASHASDYSEGAFTQPSRSSTFRFRSARIGTISTLTPTAGRRQQPPQRGQQRPNQRHVSSHRTTPSSRRASRTPIHEQHSYQTHYTSPRNQHLRSPWILRKKRSNLPFFVGGAAALVVVIFLVTTLVGTLGGSSQNTQEETLAARRCSTNAHYAYGYVRWRLHLGD